MKKNFSLLFSCLSLFIFSHSQNIGIGIATPLEKLHVSGNTLINDGLRIDGSGLNNGTISPGLRFGASNSGEGISSKRFSPGNQWGLDFYSQSLVRMSITNAGNVGIGTSSPNQMLSVAGGMNIDQNDANNGSSFNSLRFGNNSGEAIGSRRTSGTNQWGLDFYTNNIQRMSITMNGNVGVGTNTPKSALTIKHGGIIYYETPPEGKHGIAVWDSSFNLASTVLYMGAFNLQNTGYISVGNVGTSGIPPQPKLVLNPHGNPVVIGGNVPSATIPYKLVVKNGDVQFEGSLLVNTNKGIIRSNNATQQKILSADITINTSFLAGETKTFPITWPEVFGASPNVFVGQVVSGSGGWAELVLTLTNSSTTGALLYVYNPKTITVNPNYTNRIIAIGAE